ncbi:hypothetical protein [Stappia stellulata]|uniref:hypothetical protein n=1 Tax=Stappia stellulata TaxID=71235 RepID=UPI0012EBAC3D|nr:hypothetical protein [Stappia stellulata]
MCAPLHFQGRNGTESRAYKFLFIRFARFSQRVKPKVTGQFFPDASCILQIRPFLSGEMGGNARVDITEALIVNQPLTIHPAGSA